MNKVEKEFHERINQMIITGKYDEEIVERLLNIIVATKMLAEDEKDVEKKKGLLNVSIVGESLAKKLYALKGK